MFKNILERVLFFNRDYTRRNGKTLAYYLAIGILASLCTSIFLFVLFNIDKEPEIVYTRSQYMEAVEVLAEKGIVDGYTDGSFQPDKPINYEEFIKMCVSVNYPEIKPSETDYWVSPFYDKALKEGYFKKDEIDDTLYKSNLERIDMALIVGNMLDVPISKELLNAYKYKDVDENSKRGMALAKATYAGVVSGFSDGAFRPHEKVTRADAAMTLYKYLQYKDYIVTAKTSQNDK
jgi:hypothetical protein